MPNDFFNWLREMARQEGAVVIAPHQERFGNMQRSFLDGLRKCPASIVHPPGTDPYSMALGKPGRWMIIWIPDKE